jgi:hypothetical protein
MGVFTALLKVPSRDKFMGADGIPVPAWLHLFELIRDRLNPLGLEQSFELVNNKSTADNIVGLTFDSATISHAIVEYLIQRVTTGTGATELVQAGIFHLVFKPTSNTWEIVAVGTPGPSSSGITFSVTATGQVKYTSSNITGTASISRIVWRSRTISAKHSTYSQAGARS